MATMRFRFGLFEFDGTSGELRREGQPVRLQTQPALVLACLLSRPGEVVSREELCSSVWGSETFIDFERGLNFCIAQVRSALSDDANAPRYLRTIPRRGYQFIAPVSRVLDDLPEPAPAVLAKQSAVPRRRSTPARFPFWAMCTAIVLLATAWGTVRLAHRVHRDNAPIVAVLRFDNETGNPASLRYSDALTDDVVAQLVRSSGGRYSVIGNARILRMPRGERDLNAIATSLHARYIVLGQVQEDRPGRRVLAHLIRMPDQTHLWVARMDRLPEQTPADRTASEIAQEFAPRLAAIAMSSPHNSH
jgi:DNA-binding winged helix-turn-helix (wHTH) protein/TolB-like protein